MNGMIVMGLAEQRGGGELMLLHLCQQGQGLGIAWKVVFLEEGPMVAQVRELGIETFVVPAGRMREPHKFAGAIFAIARLARAHKADFILGWMSKSQLYGGPAARLAGIPALWYQLGLPAPNSLLDVAATRLPARAILACSQAGADAQATVKPSRPLRVVHPGVELERFDPALLPSPAVARRELGLPADGPLIGIVGRFQRWKGIHVLVDAMPAVLEKYPEARCVVVGGAHSLEPDYPAYVDSRIAAHSLGERVVLAGLQRNVPLWMQAMDIFVHASDREPFGIVTIEAMALGKPVVAGDEAGPTEIITPGVDGLLTPYGDAPALAAALLHYLDDPEMAARMGTAGQRRAQDFSTVRYARNLVTAVQDVLQDPDPPLGPLS